MSKIGDRKGFLNETNSLIEDLLVSNLEQKDISDGKDGKNDAI
jgi:hypothetical protein